MKKKNHLDLMHLVMLATALLTTMLAPLLARESEIDKDKSRVTFVVWELLLIDIEGSMNGVSGDIEIEENDLTNSKIDIRIDASSVETRSEDIDESLRSDLYLDVASFPEIRFTSESISKYDDRYIARGNLTILGVSKEINIFCKIVNNIWIGEFSFNRQDFDLGTQSFWSCIIADEVRANFVLHPTSNSKRA
jgi:polyisoprenoid-binding protein YceI